MCCDLPLLLKDGALPLIWRFRNLFTSVCVLCVLCYGDTFQDRNNMQAVVRGGGKCICLTYVILDPLQILDSILAIMSDIWNTFSVNNPCIMPGMGQ